MGNAVQKMERFIFAFQWIVLWGLNIRNCVQLANQNYLHPQPCFRLTSEA
jgi:hypothetical protein